MVRIFVGDFKTGEILYGGQSDSGFETEEVIDELSTKLGWTHVIWATYDAKNSMESCIRNFKEYIAFRYEMYEREEFGIVHEQKMVWHPL